MGINCPDEPEQTCPLIDAVIEEIDKLIAIERNTCIMFDGIYFKDVKDKMEEIRSANSDLRERAQFFEQQAGEFEEEKDKLRERNEALELELTGYATTLARHLEDIGKLETRLALVEGELAKREAAAGA